MKKKIVYVQTFICFVWVLSIGTIFSRPIVGEEPTRVEIYAGEYPGWPWITRDHKGELLVVFREGTKHEYSESGRALLTRSQDHGKSWSKPTVISDIPEVDDRNVALTVMRDGEYVAVFNTYDKKLESEAMVCRSRDEGRTWSKPTSIGTLNTRTKGAIVELKSGRWVLPFYVAPGNGALVGISDDQGEHWNVKKFPDPAGFLGDEWDLVEFEPNRLLGVFRNNQNGSDGSVWISTSEDGGSNWSPLKRSNMQSKRFPSPADVDLQQGKPIAVFADARMVSVSAAVPTDPEFLNWKILGDSPKYFYEADHQPIADGSYPVSVEIDAATRLVVDYEIRDNKKVIAGYFIKVP